MFQHLYLSLAGEAVMRKNKIYIIFIVLIFLTFLSTSSITGCKIAEGEKEEKIEISGFKVITPEEVYEIIKNKKDYIILDVRTQGEYDAGHIEGAILIPILELEERLNELPKDKPIIVYCNSGVRSNAAAKMLTDKGFRNIYDMGGISDWQEKGFPVVVEEIAEDDLDVKYITVDEAYKIYLNDEKYLFIDVRSEGEYESGHIEGAINIPVSEIANSLDEVPTDKPIIVYCNGSSCHRSSRAAEVLMENGFKEVYVISGKGIIEWEEKGYPVEIEESSAIGSVISVDDAYEIFKSGIDHLFLDVRLEDEYRNGHVEGALNIPVEELDSRLEELPKDLKIIAYCCGPDCGRSGSAIEILIENGFTNLNEMIEGFPEWERKGYPVQ